MLYLTVIKIIAVDCKKEHLLMSYTSRRVTLSDDFKPCDVTMEKTLTHFTMHSAILAT